MRQDATSVLLKAIAASFEPEAGFVLEEIESHGWVSVTFAGARHKLSFRLEGEKADCGAERFLANLGAEEFDLNGHVLADITLTAQEVQPGPRRIRLEALTVED